MDEELELERIRRGNKFRILVVWLMALFFFGPIACVTCGYKSAGYRMKRSPQASKTAESEAPPLYEELEIDPENDLLRMRLAECLLSDGDWSQAVEVLDEGYRYYGRQTEYVIRIIEILLDYEALDQASGYVQILEQEDQLSASARQVLDAYRLQQEDD